VSGKLRIRRGNMINLVRKLRSAMGILGIFKESMGGTEFVG
jgi:hypothetical protein